MDGYLTALEAAGADVLHYNTFGNWQGTWIAILPGNLAIEGAYGSCDGCDEFEKFFWNRDERSYGYKDLLAEFGRSLLARAVPIKQIITAYTNRIQEEKDRADPEDKEILAWLIDLHGVGRESAAVIIGRSVAKSNTAIRWEVEVCETWALGLERVEYLNSKLMQAGLHFNSTKTPTKEDIKEFLLVDDQFVYMGKGSHYYASPVPFRKS